MCRNLLLVLALVAAPAFGATGSVSSAISTDPPPDAAHPATMKVLHIPSHGVSINGIVYVPAGTGRHPTAILCHGLPGNEKNLDLAQALRRAGWNAVTFNYRGSWGSAGEFRFAQNLEDAESVLAYLRDPVHAEELGVDTRSMVLIGHSMGGWVTALTAARDPGLKAAVLISAANIGRLGQIPRANAVAVMADNMEALTGVTADSMADEVHAHAQEFLLQNAVTGLSRLPLLVLSSNDGLGSESDALVKAIRDAGGTRVTARHVDTDHGWSDHRIALEKIVLTWLAALR